MFLVFNSSDFCEGKATSTWQKFSLCLVGKKNSSLSGWNSAMRKTPIQTILMTRRSRYRLKRREIGKKRCSRKNRRNQDWKFQKSVQQRQQDAKHRNGDFRSLQVLRQAPLRSGRSWRLKSRPKSHLESDAAPNVYNVTLCDNVTLKVSSEFYLFLTFLLRNSEKRFGAKFLSDFWKGEADS